MSDRIFGVLGMLLAAFFIWGALRIELSFISDPVGPRSFPILIAAVLGLSSLAILLRPDIEPRWPETGGILDFAQIAIAWGLVALILPAGLVELGLGEVAGLSSAHLCLLAAPVVAALAGRLFGGVSRLAEIALAALLMVAYSLALPEAGFLIATAWTAAVLTWRLGTTVPGSVVAGVLTALGIYVLFHKVLGLSLSEGPLDGYVDAAVDPVVELFSRRREG